MSAAKVRKDFGQGRTMGAQAAKAAGLIDRIETLDQAIRRVAGKKSPAEAVAASVTPPQPMADHSAQYEGARAKARVL